MRQRSSTVTRMLLAAALSLCQISGTALAHDPGLGSEWAAVFLVAVVIATVYQLSLLLAYLYVKGAVVRSVLYAFALGPALVAASDLLSKYYLSVRYFLAVSPDAGMWESLTHGRYPTRIYFNANDAVAFSEGRSFGILEWFAFAIICLTLMAPLLRRRLHRKRGEEEPKKCNIWVGAVLAPVIVLLCAVPKAVVDTFSAIEMLPEIRRTEIHGAFMASVRQGALENFNRLLREHHELVGSAASLQKALRIAAEHGQKEMEVALLQKGAIPNLVDAVSLGRQDWVDAALSGAPEKTKSINLLQAEIACIQKKNYAFLELLGSYAEPYQDHRNDPVTFLENGGPVFLAVKNNDMRALKMIAPHTNLHYYVAFGNTALHLAAGKGNVEILTYLLSLHADPNVKTRIGTPLHVAAEQGKLETMRILIKAGADVDGNPDGSEIAPLSRALWQRQTEAAFLLLDAGAKPNANVLAYAKQMDQTAGSLIVARIEAMLSKSDCSE